MADFTLTIADRFANGATLGAYPVSAWGGLRPSGSPIGSATNTQTVTNQSVTFTGLTAGVDYYAAVNSSTTNYVRFTVPSTALNSDDLDSLAADVQAALDTKPTATLDTDSTMAANSDTAVASQKATKTYTDNTIFLEAIARIYADTVNGFAGIAGPTGVYGLKTTSATALSANKAYYVRVFAPRAMNITSIRFLVTTAAGSNDNVDVGVFNGTTGAKIVSSGATAGKLNSTGMQSVSISTTLAAGTAYYLGLSCGTIGSTAAQLLMTDLAYWETPKLFGSSMPLLIQGDQTTAHPLPSTAAPASGQVAAILVAKE